MIKIICIGKIKEKYLTELINDYKTRINKYHKLEIIELKDSNKKEEEKLILSNIKPTDHIISLCINGEELTTTEFTETIEKLLTNGNSNITFIIGGSKGLSEKVINTSKKQISFSKLTYPHGLFRGILLEQIYRAFKIINNETYHK